MMKLDPKWKAILRRAWSVRLIAAAAILSGAEFAFPLFGDHMPRVVFAVGGFALTAAALVARIVVQDGLDG